MKKLLLLFFFLFVSIIVSAQTQQGVVKTRGRMVNGQLQPGRGLAGATVQVKNRSAVVSNNNGAFSFPIPAQSYQLQSVKKNGFQLVDADALMKPYKYSANPLLLVMETPEQQMKDQLEAEKKIRRNLRRQLYEKETEIENLRNASQAEKDSLLRILYQQQTDNEKLIADMAKRYSTLDYDQLEEFYRRVNEFIENGELTRADSMLRTRGDVKAQVEAELLKGQAIQEQKEQLRKAEATLAADIDELARRCYSYYESFKQQHLNDSAAFYLELRASLDTTNVEWQLDVANFLLGYTSEYDKTLARILRTLDYARNHFTEQSAAVMKCHIVASSAYLRKKYRSSAINQAEAALKIAKSIYGENDGETAMVLSLLGMIDMSTGGYKGAIGYFLNAISILDSIQPPPSRLFALYSNLGSAYRLSGDYEKALESYNYALEGMRRNGENNAGLLENIGTLYSDIGNYSEALKYQMEAFELTLKQYGNYHYLTANTYNNLGVLYLRMEQLNKAKECFDRALSIGKDFYGENHLNITEYYEHAGLVEYKLNNYDRALELLEHVIPIYKTAYGNSNIFFTKKVESLIAKIKAAREQNTK